MLQKDQPPASQNTRACIARPEDLVKSGMHGKGTCAVRAQAGQAQTSRILRLLMSTLEGPR